MKYVVIIEKAKDNTYSAYIPDLPGCVSAGETVEEVKRMIKEAMEFHIEGMIEDGEEIPEPSAVMTEVIEYAKTA